MSFQVRNAKRAKLHTADTPQWKVHRDMERGPVFRGPDRDTFRTIDVLQVFCDLNSQQLEYADEYGEPGYSNPEKGILLAGWNDIPESLQTRLESQGFELEWPDEWYIDSENSPTKAWRTQADDMSWEPRVRCGDGYMMTPDSDPQEWIDSSLNDENEPLPSWFDTDELTRRGFAQSVTGHDPSNRLRSVFDECRKEGYDVILVNASSHEYNVWTRREAERHCIVDGSFGVYVPQRFAENIDRALIAGVSMEDLDELAKGPPDGLASTEGGSEHYDDIWSDVLDNAKITSTDGKVYRLDQDGDLFMAESAGEYCDFDGNYYVHKE